MSGHSHAKKVKHQKEATAAQRSKIFSKLGSELYIAAKEGGGDPGTNPRLRHILDRARAVNMPTANIERSIKRGTGEEKGAALEEVLFEGYGPGGIAVLVEGITDNKNRTLGEVKRAFEKNQGKLAGEGAVRWMFARRGTLSLPPGDKPKDALELLSIEAGAEDMYWREDGTLEIYTKPTQVEQVKKVLEERGILVESASLQWVPKERVALSEKDTASAEKLFLALDESDTVQEIYANLAT
ncbi:YebC/PmpR family DNA-binding transcriptional regulator [Patescibacteria group bacterium]|nr:YebC/PmpR family DNA-binding transcriptional regulator [Patescibacteria group bacterium]